MQTVIRIALSANDGKRIVKADNTHIPQNSQERYCEKSKEGVKFFTRKIHVAFKIKVDFKMCQNCFFKINVDFKSSLS